MSSPSPTAFANVQYVFLDRDGVINRKLPEGEYVSSWHSFQILPAAEEAIARLNRSGRTVIVVTNQRGIALGHYTEADVNAVHEELQRHLSQSGAHIDAFYFCPHDKNQCNCRKPKIGLFEQALDDFPEASGHNSIVIGDSLSDIEAARNFGAPSIFVEGDPEFQKPGAEKARSLADASSQSLSEAVTRFLS
jgi:D-glycero-D-manno-heptose 1,7-bisphosphate phosphatase